MREAVDVAGERRQILNGGPRTAPRTAHPRGTSPPGSAEIVCLVPVLLGERLRDSIAAHLDAEPRVAVILDRRRADRRRASDRRATTAAGGPERRLIKNNAGRRIGERRAELAPIPPLSLPTVAARFATRIAFAERVAHSGEELADLEDLRLVTRLQSGDEAAFDPIYDRYLSRLHVYAQAALGDPHEAEDVAHEVLIKMLEAVPDYEIRGIPFRIWLFRVLQNHVRNHFAKHRRVVVEDPLTIHGRVETDCADGARVTVDQRLFERFAREDFMAMIDRLSEPQRQVLSLRFLLGFDLPEIAKLLGISSNAAANLQYRALGALRDERAPAAAEPSSGHVRPARFAMRRLPRPSALLQARRGALHAFSW